MSPPPPISTLFPYTTLFRSLRGLPDPIFERARQLSRQTTARLGTRTRSEEHTSELQSHSDLVCRLLLEKKKKSRMSPAMSRRRMKGTGPLERAIARSVQMWQ